MAGREDGRQVFHGVWLVRPWRHHAHLLWQPLPQQVRRKSFSTLLRLASQLCLCLAPQSGFCQALHKHPSLQRYDTAACLPSACFGTYFMCVLQPQNLTCVPVWHSRTKQAISHVTASHWLFVSLVFNDKLIESSKQCSMIVFVRRSKLCR